MIGITLEKNRMRETLISEKGEDGIKLFSVLTFLFLSQGSQVGINVLGALEDFTKLLLYFLFLTRHINIGCNKQL